MTAGDTKEIAIWASAVDAIHQRDHIEGFKEFHIAAIHQAEDLAMPEQTIARSNKKEMAKTLSTHARKQFANRKEAYDHHSSKQITKDLGFLFGSSRENIVSSTYILLALRDCKRRGFGVADTYIILYSWDDSETYYYRITVVNLGEVLKESLKK